MHAVANCAMFVDVKRCECRLANSSKPKPQRCELQRPDCDRAVNVLNQIHQSAIPTDAKMALLLGHVCLCACSVHVLYMCML